MTTRALRILFAGIVSLFSMTAGLQSAELVKVTGDRVNVRARASTGSEVVTQLREGESVVFIEEVGSGDRGLRWAKIQLPDNTPVWTSAEFINPADKTVIPQRLNVRSGPGVNFNIVGELIRGETVKEIRTVQGWMEIAAPQGSAAFVAAKFLSNFDASAAPAPAATAAAPAAADKKTTPAPMVAAPVITTDDASLPIPSAIRPKVPASADLTVGTAIIEPSAPVLSAPSAPKLVDPGSVPAEPRVTEVPAEPLMIGAGTTTTVAEPKVAGTSTIAVPDGPGAMATTAPTTVTVPSGPETTVPAPAPTTVEVPVVPIPDAPTPGEFDDPDFERRVVTRLGLVRYAFNIQAPTSYKLIDPRSKRFMNYLYSSDTGLELKYYSGKTIQVTGEEYIDKRWPSRPLIEIRTLKPLPE